jgi:hypothetical protein
MPSGASGFACTMRCGVINFPSVAWGSRSREADGLSGERKRLAERYTIDEVEARRRERLAAEAATRRSQEAPATAIDGPSGTEGDSPATSETAMSNGELRTRRWVAPLAERLSKLREQLDQPAYAVDTLLPDHDDGLGTLGGENDHFRCANCGDDGSRGEDGWTLQLCGDYQLHAFCRDCTSKMVPAWAGRPTPR